MSKNTKIILGIIIAVVAIGGIWWRVSKKTDSVTEEEVIKIGFIGPLTGPFAEWGESIKCGALIALENTKNKFNVDYQDSICEPEQTVTIANKFFNIDKINLIIGPGCITGFKAIIPIAEQKNSLLFSTGLLDDSVFKEYKNIINLASQISTEGKYLAKYLSSKNIKKIAIVHGTNAFGIEHGKRFPIFLKKYNIEVTSIQPTNIDTLDFRTIILKMMQTNPEAIFIHQGESQIGTFVKQMRELRYKTQIYSYYGSESQSVINAGEGAMEGVEYTYPVNNAENSTEKQNFEKNYAEKFGNDKVPSATSFFVYDGIVLIDKALDLCETNDVDCIKNFFKNIGKYSGISGEMKFEEDGSITRPFGIKKIENGKFVWITKKIEL